LVRQPYYAWNSLPFEENRIAVEEINKRPTTKGRGEKGEKGREKKVGKEREVRKGREGKGEGKGR